MRIGKRLSRFALFASTLLSSAWNQWRITGRVQWRVLPKILLALARGHQAADRRPGSMWWQRQRGCAGRWRRETGEQVARHHPCPLYDRHRRACGHLGQTYQRGGKVMILGCQCFLPLKADIEDVGCWLWIETGGEAGVDWSKTVAKSSS